MKKKNWSHRVIYNKIESLLIKFFFRFLIHNIESRKLSFERVHRSLRKTNIVSVILVVWLLIGSLFFIKNLYTILGQFDLFFIKPDDVLREKVYGDIYKLSLKLQEDKHKEPFILISNDGWDYFLLRYLIYPKEIIWIKDARTLFKSDFKSGLYVLQNISDYRKGSTREKYLLFDEKELQFFFEESIR